MPVRHVAPCRAQKAQRPSRLSKCGQWMSFPKVPNLLKYVSSGRYFARVKIDGKIIRRTTVPLLPD